MGYTCTFVNWSHGAIRDLRSFKVSSHCLCNVSLIVITQSHILWPLNIPESIVVHYEKVSHFLWNISNWSILYLSLGRYNVVAHRLFIMGQPSVEVIVGFFQCTITLGTGQYLLGIWDQCVLNFQCKKKSISYLKRKQKLLSYHCWGWKSLRTMIILAKNMCPIAICTGPNPQMNIDLSLNSRQPLSPLRNW